MSQHYDEGELQQPGRDTDTPDSLEQMLLVELSNAVARHTRWLDGKTYQRLCQQVAEAYFEQYDLYQVTMLDESNRQEWATAIGAAIDKPSQG